MSLQAVDSQEFSGKESFWLRLLSMLAGVFPVTSMTTFNVSHLRWALFPVVLMATGLYLLINKIKLSIEEGLDIASFPENTTAAVVNDKKASLGSHIWVMTMALIMLAGTMSLSLSRKQFLDNFPPELLHWFGSKAKKCASGAPPFSSLFYLFVAASWQSIRPPRFVRKFVDLTRRWGLGICVCLRVVSAVVRLYESPFCALRRDAEARRSGFCD